MAWIPMYLLEEDVAFLNDWLNVEDEIAFLVANGYKQWIARKEHNILADLGNQTVAPDRTDAIPGFAEYHLWHVPSGPLPLLEPPEGGGRSGYGRIGRQEESRVEEPWLGWTELRAGANTRIPYLGSGHPGLIHLEIRLPQGQEIPLSSFGWIGNTYSAIGKAADPLTKKFWAGLKAMVKKVGTAVPRGNVPGGKKEVFAFPTAYKEITDGRPCAFNP